MESLAAARVAVFGTGGVGSWCAEALVRTGVGGVTLVDDDVVAPSNANRQLPATSKTIGLAKVEVLARRFAEVSPSVEIVALRERYTADNPAFPPGFFARLACVVDAIDSVADKAALIRAATAAGVPVFSSMGAALRTDPTAVRVSPFDKVGGDGLAKALRRRFRDDGLGPTPDFLCAHSLERPRDCAVRGSAMPVTAAFGMALASLAIDCAAGIGRFAR